MRRSHHLRFLCAILVPLALAGCGSKVTIGGALPPAKSANQSAQSRQQSGADLPPSIITDPQRPGRLQRLGSVPPPDANTVVVDVLQNRHPISPLIYGVNFPANVSYVTDSGATLVRWGGNASTRYNWKNFDTNAANDWYFINRTMDDSNSLYQDSRNFVSSIANAGAVPIMTIGMLPWVAKDATAYSFSIAKYGAQCGHDPYNPDHGNGMKTDCNTPVTGNDPNDAHVPLLDSPGNNDPNGSVYRSQWVAALAPKYGNAPHWYDMDNEVDIWAGTHRDVHPTPVGYDELRDTYLTEARTLKTWDPNAVRLGPVSCCWWFYWNAAAGDDKDTHGGVDLLPWWLNEIAWSDQIAGSRSLDVFDIHAYADAPDYSGYSTAQKRALALRVMRDYWDPTYVSESGTVNQEWATFIQPNKTIPFRVPRMRAILNSTYPNTPLSFTEWNAAFAGESDFSTALVDVETYGIMGRERVYAATRWTAADSGTSAYQALKLYRNYDGQHHAFGTISVAADHGADPNLFSSYAAVDAAGTTLTVVLVNKDPGNATSKTVAISGFNPLQVRSYTLSSANPNTIVAGSPKTWTSDWNLPAYSATLLVITGSMTNAENTEWDPNPDVTIVPAGGTTTLQPRITSGSGSVNLSQVISDPGITLTLTQPHITTGQNGSIAVSAGANPGFYRFAVTGVDHDGVTQTQEGWILVGNPPATLIKTGDGQTGTRGSVLNLSVQINVGQSGGSAEGASILFTTDQGSLSVRKTKTDSSGRAAVQLTLPNTPGTVHVTAEGPFELGHPLVTFTETSQ
jgi:hypothetical protein